MTNDRGNKYSRNHTKLNPDRDHKFWNYSWHEIGTYDLPASIDHILNHTSERQLYFIGLSQGSTIMYVMLSALPEYNEKIKAYLNMAPCVYMKNLKSKLIHIKAVLLDTIQVSIYSTIFFISFIQLFTL